MKKILAAVLFFAFASAQAAGVIFQGFAISVDSAGNTIVSAPGGAPPPAIVCVAPQVLQNGVCVTPPPPPVITGCAANFNMLAGDLDWNPLVTTQVWPRGGPTQADGDAGRAVRFVADATQWANGLYMSLIDQTPELRGKDAVISACPHDFTAVNGQAGCSASNVSNTNKFYLRFGAAVAWYDCALMPGKSYFLNVRDHATPRATVYTQFSAEPR